ncbi:MAG: putative rane protein [Pseudonocardia sp.]|nr:putative rane protein [Pseudonocardia sp.]
MSLTGERPPEITQYQQIQASPEFIELKRKLRNFIFPMSAAFLLWYLAFVLLATYAPEFMQTKVLGNINIGLIIGLSQFVTTFLITMLYVRYANRQLDPLSEKLRREIEEAGL